MSQVAEWSTELWAFKVVYSGWGVGGWLVQKHSGANLSGLDWLLLKLLIALAD